MPECELMPHEPYPPQTLLTMGLLYAYISGVPNHLREDAAQEFVAAGWTASSSAEHGGNLQAFQVQAARWALRNFLKAEIRRHKRQERYMNLKFGVTPDDITPDDYDLTDPSAEDPLQQMISGDDRERCMSLLRDLPEFEQAVITEIILEGKTQEETAKAHGVAQSTVSHALQKNLANFRRKIE